TVMQVAVEIPAVDVVLADQLCFVGLIDCGLEHFALADELAADIDVANMRAHRERGDKASLHQRLWIVPHDVPVLAGAGLGLISVDHEIRGPSLYLLRHEGPLQAGGKPGAAATAQAGLLDGVDDRFGAFFDELLGAVPGAAPLCGLEAPIPETVEVGE